MASSDPTPTAQTGVPLGAFFDRLDIRAPTTTIYSCATAAPYPDDAHEVRRLAVAQWMRPVRFRETIEAMYEVGARVFVDRCDSDQATAAYR